ncbi:MAG: amidohydrolase family protein [Alphaproteobacteria bacterium]|nr:amidohydrolase family protein [Alphaproteobacteria bacterium]
MSENPDLVIRSGTIIDGSGGAPYQADIAVTDGKISAIGQELPKGAAEIDAHDRIVTPGFVDVHTHYDAQVTWSNRINPSSWNGVTTVMIGNCGVGFAPCRPDQRDKLVELMEGVEDIPEPVLSEGLPWNWETFGDYLDALDGKPFDLDVVTQVPHAALRVYVMGERGVAREDATPEDRAEMARLAADGIRAGALGFSTSRTINHRTVAGAYTPTLGAAEQELIEISKAVGETGSGWLQVISDFDDPVEEMGILRRLAQASGRPMTITVLQRDKRPELWRETMADIAAANAEGARIFGQVLTRPTGVMLGFEISLNPFMACPAWREIADLPQAEKFARLSQPDFKARILAERQEDHLMHSRVTQWDRIFPLGDPPDYEPAADKSIAARAAREGRTPEDMGYDMLLEGGGKAILYRPLSNYAYGNLDTVADMMQHPNSLIGLGDGGAHVGVLTDASAITYMLTHWTRDRDRGAKLSLPWAIKRLTHDNAAAIGLNDRGLLAVGRKADINVIDYDNLKIRAPEVLYDLPGGGKRMVQRTDGYDATIVAGQIVCRHGEATDALPGRLVRGARA